MGLAPYGTPRYMDELRKIVRIQRDGSFELDLDYFELSGKGALMTWAVMPLLARVSFRWLYPQR